MKMKMEELEHMKMKVDIQTSHINEHKKEILSLKSRVGLLVQSSDGYLSIRRRFLDVYKRDVQGELTGSKAIQEGNSIAHEGDALGDAVLFDRDHRTDARIYRELYGLDYKQVLEFHSSGNDGGLFLVLNAHATRLSQGRPLPDHVKAAFNSFVANVEDHWLQPPNKEPSSPLGSAYFTFWEKFNALQ